MVERHVQDSKGAIRAFNLGISDAVSHALIEGVARARKGYSQVVVDVKVMSGKVGRMMEGATFTHITDCSLKVKYGSSDEDDFEIVDKVLDCLVIDDRKSLTRNYLLLRRFCWY